MGQAGTCAAVKICVFFSVMYGPLSCVEDAQKPIITAPSEPRRDIGPFSALIVIQVHGPPVVGAGVVKNRGPVLLPSQRVGVVLIRISIRPINAEEFVVMHIVPYRNIPIGHQVLNSEPAYCGQQGLRGSVLTDTLYVGNHITTTRPTPTIRTGRPALARSATTAPASRSMATTSTTTTAPAWGATSPARTSRSRTTGWA